METLHISSRLKKIAKYIAKGSYFADIGSDHAYLPTYVCLNDPTSKAIAGEVNQGPFQNAQDVVNMYDLTKQIDVRLGDGLDVLHTDLPDTLVIAGMGGKLIERILTDNLHQTLQINKLILQPNIDADRLRKWFIEQNYYLTHEEIVEENDHFYEILVAEQIEHENVYDASIDQAKQIYFGPLLLKERSTEFLKKWQLEKTNLQRIIKDMKQAKQINELKLNQFKNKLNWIEEVLNYESDNK